MLAEQDDETYDKLIRRYDVILEKDPYNYNYHYLKGYGYTLIYSMYYIGYSKALKKWDPGFLDKLTSVFWTSKDDPEYFLDKMEKYYELSEESLQIAIRRC